MKPRQQRGQVAIEAVLVVPLLFLLVFLVFEFGHVFGQWLIVTNAAREGARFAITQPYGSSSNSAIMQQVVASAQGLDSTLNAVACNNNQPPSGQTSCIGITWIQCPVTAYTSLCNGTSQAYVAVLVRYNITTVFQMNGQVPGFGTFNYPGTVQITGLSYMRSS